MWNNTRYNLRGEFIFVYHKVLKILGLEVLVAKSEEGIMTHHDGYQDNPCDESLLFLQVL